jgi:hypothetical protein
MLAQQCKVGRLLRVLIPIVLWATPTEVGRFSQAGNGPGPTGHQLARVCRTCNRVEELVTHWQSPGLCREQHPCKLYEISYCRKCGAAAIYCSDVWPEPCNGTDHRPLPTFINKSNTGLEGDFHPGGGS